MSAGVDLTQLNFEWRIGLITPTEQSLCSLSFETHDPRIGLPEQGPGNLRKFWVGWLGSGPDIGGTNMDSREAEHDYQLVVAYPFVLSWSDMHVLIGRDLHDLIRALRSAQQSDLVGYDDDHPTTDIGLYDRLRARTRLDRNTDPTVWLLIVDWRCKIFESEL